MAKVIDALSHMWKILNRKKTLTEEFEDTPLRKCLTTFDILLLGVGHMVGAGIYVTTGTVIKNLAGPSAILSYLFAGMAAMLSALCYAEFGAHVPKAGSAYSYIFVTLGEVWGFMVGWNVILEQILGTASVARAWSGSMDTLFNGAIRNGTITAIGSLGDSNWHSDYPDFLAFGVCIVSFAFVATSAKVTLRFNNIITLLNVLVLAFIIIAGFCFADVKHWIDPAEGGFFPHGISGTFSGAAACFFAYIGFEGIATSAEEATNPAKSIPIASIGGVTIVTLFYVLICTSLTLVVPYNEVDISAPYPQAFATRGVYWIQYIIAIGTLFGISTSLLGGAFSLPRSVYSMASDGLLFRFLSNVNEKTQTPVAAIAVFGLLSGLMAMLFEMETLVEFLSIGTLFAYTIVAFSVIVLRYMPVTKCQFKLRTEEPDAEVDEVSSESASEKHNIVRSKSHDEFGRLRQSLRNIPVLRQFDPGNAAILATSLMVSCMLALAAIIVFGMEYLTNRAWWAVTLLVFFSACVVFFYMVIIAHEQNSAFLTFQVSYLFTFYVSM